MICQWFEQIEQKKIPKRHSGIWKHWVHWVIGQIRQRCWCETTWGWHLDGGNDRRYEKTGKTAGIRKKSGVRMPAFFEPTPFFWGSHLKRPSIKLRTHFDNNYLIGGLERVLIFIPNWRSHSIIFRWRKTTNQLCHLMSPSPAVAPLSSTQRTKKSRSSKTIKRYRGHEDWRLECGLKIDIFLEVHLVTLWWKNTSTTCW